MSHVTPVHNMYSSAIQRPHHMPFQFETYTCLNVVPCSTIAGRPCVRVQTLLVDTPGPRIAPMHQSPLQLVQSSRAQVVVSIVD
jgi:hypothetical protein